MLWAIQVSFTLFHTFRLGAQRTFEPGEDIVISGKRMIRERNIARMFAALSATNEAVLRTTSQEELYQRVCEAAVHEGAFKGAIVLLAEPDNSLRFVAGTGDKGLDVLRDPKISVDAGSVRGRGLAGEAFRSGRSCISNDYLNDGRVRPWHEDGRRFGIGAAAAVPVIKNGSSAGVLMFYLGEPGTLDDQAVDLGHPSQ